MRKTSKTNSERYTVTKTFSFYPEVSYLLAERAAFAGWNPSKYVSELIRFDKSDNTVGEILKRETERVTADA